MSTHHTRRTLAAIGIGGLIAAATLAAPQAHATPQTYLQALADQGLTVYDPAAALASGYRMCSMLLTANGEQVAQYVFEHTSWSDVPTIAVARAEVVISVEELCPAQDHRGQQANAPVPAIGGLSEA